MFSLCFPLFCWSFFLYKLLWENILIEKYLSLYYFMLMLTKQNRPYGKVLLLFLTNKRLILINAVDIYNC